MSAPPIDPRRCPVCGAPNECGIAEGRDTCWCFSVHVPSGVLEAVPPEAKGRACVCKACVENASSSNSAGDALKP